MNAQDDEATAPEEKQPAATEKPAEKRPVAKAKPKSEPAKDEGDDVPWPDEWLEESRKHIVAGTLTLTVLVVLAAVFCYTRWQDESYGQSIALGFLAIIGLAWLRFVLISKLRNRWKPLDALRVEDVPDVDERGVVFHYAPAIHRTYWTSLILVTLLAAGITAGLVWLGLDDGWSMWLYLEIVVMALLTLYGLRFLLDFAGRRIRSGMVGLTPRGVYHRSWTFSGFMPWEYVDSVAAVDVSGPVVLVSTTENFVTPIQQTSKLWKQGELELLPDLAIRGRWLAVDAAVCFHALNWYHRNPAARAELATDAGATRIREQKVLVEAGPTPGEAGPA